LAALNAGSTRSSARPTSCASLNWPLAARLAARKCQVADEARIERHGAPPPRRRLGDDFIAWNDPTGDVVIGGNGADVIDGGGGNDFLTGWARQGPHEDRDTR
jgi:hypothetical protein